MPHHWRACGTTDLTQHMSELRCRTTRSVELSLTVPVDLVLKSTAMQRLTEFIFEESSFNNLS